MVIEAQVSSVGVVIVNWKRWQLCLDCLSALRKTEGATWHLYLVDNASNDGSSEKLTDLGSDVTYIQSNINGGWTGGNNIGVRAALECGHPYIFVLNNDAMVEPSTLQVLLNAAADTGDSTVYGPFQRNSSNTGYSFTGSEVDANTGMPGWPQPILYQDEAIAPIPNRISTAYVQGSAMFVPRAVFTQIGLFEERYYLNYDDSDWCFRARKAGVSLIMLKEATIEHDGSGTIGGGTSPLNVYFLTRNGLLFSELHCNSRQRRRVIKDLVDYGMRLTGRSNFIKRARALIVGRDPALRAYRLGIKDYRQRRFGDCPQIIRELQADSNGR
jgi:hypothetical protein